jgi:signal transduction histidine kinase
MNRDPLLKIRSSPLNLLNAALAVTVLILVSLAYFTYVSHQKTQQHQTATLRLATLQGTIKHLDEVLTMSAHMAAMTGLPEWEARYRRYEPDLDHAIKEATALSSVSSQEQASHQTDEANQKLVEMENRSFELVRAGDKAAALEILLSKEYKQQKEIYTQGTNTVIDSLSQLMTSNQQQQEQSINYLIIAAGICVLLLLVTWMAVLGNWKRTQQRLIETSRLAGMAEVATSVLHNVGNVLNSVNVSGNVIAERLQSSKVHVLTRAADLLKGHREDFVNFVVNDPRGKRIPDLVCTIHDALREEHRGLQDEVKVITTHIAHIKQIVAMQQDHSKTGGWVEKLDPLQLMEDALRINAASMLRHDVKIQQDYEPTTQIQVDPHKVLQILVNLLSNARDAVAEHRPEEKHVTVGICQLLDKQIQFSVRDNGCGIALDNLTRIFAHGFTTKKTGHGFGLHSSALVAAELGGKLTAHSDGPGKGACFYLELPCSPSQPIAA